jgi:retron-type reverse transcriptase
MNEQNCLYLEICSYANLEAAFKKAKKRKSTKLYVVEFEKNLSESLTNLRNELVFHTYKPVPLKTFIICDPKTRKICKSAFRDRVVHHALVRIIEPIFEKTFIYDSYANRKGKGVHSALNRFDCFKRKVSKNNTRTCYVLKADIRHYFETVDQEILIKIISKRIKDRRVIWLIRRILNNYNSKQTGKGMPLGNLTSQFFANVYLNELDQFVKQKLKAKHYIRYVDDFVILLHSKEFLENCKEQINNFLKNELRIELHPDKSKIISLNKGIRLLGFKVFYYHKLLRRSNLNKFLRKLSELKEKLALGLISEESLAESVQGWVGYAMHGNTYSLRKKLLS